MPDNKKEKLIPKLQNNKIVNLVFFVLSIVATYLVIVLPISLRPTPTLMDVGDVALQDIHAPRSFSFVSAYLTDIAKDEAEKSVTPVYLPPDTTINRNQIEKLTATLDYISTIRLDEFAEHDQKFEDLQALEAVSISPELADRVLALSDERWDIVRNQTLNLLETVMRNSIREDQITRVKNELRAKIGFNFSDNETAIIENIVSQMIVANSIYSNERTSEAIAIAREEVEPVSHAYTAGETIISNGEVIDPLSWEALQELGLTEQTDRTLDFISAALIVLSMMTLVVVYFRRIKQTKGYQLDGVPIIALLFFIFLTAARLIIPNHTVLPYIFPIAAFGLLIASVFDYETGLIGALVLGVLSAYNQSNSVDLALYYFIPSAVAIFILGRGRRINIFFLSGMALSIVSSAIVIAYRLTNSFLDFSGAVALIGAAFANGVLSTSIALVMQYLISQLLGKTTAMQLMDLSRPDHPLLHTLLTTAPGTYQHSLQLANLGEQAAREVNGDALLTRVGALYHDIGKSENSTFFIENQPVGKMDTHEDMDPVLSAAAIIRHVPDGVKLAKKYRIPTQIQDFILEHHGTTITRYQYSIAVADAGGEDKVDRCLFAYPGPIPHRKETAILMLADGCEARMRSENPESVADIERIVQESVDYYLQAKQLNNADLTLRDIQTIIQSFARTFKNSYHHRIKYPGQAENQEK